jgi:hypothetical protein
MGRNKDLRKKIRSQLRVINNHLDKIAAELEKPYPNRERIAKWQKDVEIHQKELLKLTGKLPGKQAK